MCVSSNVTNKKKGWSTIFFYCWMGPHFRHIYSVSRGLASLIAFKIATMVCTLHIFTDFPITKLDSQRFCSRSGYRKHTICFLAVLLVQRSRTTSGSTFGHIYLELRNSSLSVITHTNSCILHVCLTKFICFRNCISYQTVFLCTRICIMSP